MKDGMTASCASQVVTWYLKDNIDLLYANLPVLLDLPKSRLLPPRLPSRHHKQRKRIRMYNDIFDCEDSDDEKQAKKMDQESANIQAKPTQAKLSKGGVLLGKSVQVLADLYDSLSQVDAYVSLPECQEGPCGHNPDFSWTSGRIMPGLQDSFSCESSHTHITDMNCDITGYVSVQALQLANHRLQEVQQQARSLEPGQSKQVTSSLCLPVPAEDVGNNKLHVSQECVSQYR